MEKKLALVTGGISGIGKATVYELAKKGYDLAIIARSAEDSEKVQTVLKECAALGAKAVYRQCDIHDVNAVDEVFQWIKETYGKLDCAVNNAGYGLPDRKFGDVTAEEIHDLVGINVIGTLNCVRNEVNLMLANGYGRIVNIASGAGIMPSKGGALYGACKAAVIGITKGVALDYVKDNITVNCIAPGTIETELLKGLSVNYPEYYEKIKGSNPIGRMGEPWEIARVIAFLLEEDSCFINGTVIPVDSGWAAGFWKK